MVTHRQPAVAPTDEEVVHEAELVATLDVLFPGPFEEVKCGPCLQLSSTVYNCLQLTVEDR